MSEHHIQTLLGVLGVPTGTEKSFYCCPLHAKPTFTLSFLLNTILHGDYRVKCNHPNCRFDGNVFELLIRITDNDRAKITDMFMPDGPLYDTFLKAQRNRSLDHSMLMEIFNTIAINDEVKAYIAKGRKLLETSAVIRAKLTGMGIREEFYKRLTIGCYSPQAPDVLLQNLPKYGKGDYMTFPYSCGGMVTSIDVHDPESNRQHHVVISESHEISGVFQEEHLSDEGPIIVCPDELAAITYSSRIFDITTKPSNACCFKSVRSATNVSPDRELVFLSPADNILSLSRAIHYWQLRDERKLSVVEIPHRLAKLSGAALRQLERTGVDLSDWIVDYLVRLNHTESPMTVRSTVSAAGLSKHDKQELVDLLIQSGVDDPLFLSAVKDAKTEGSVYKHGKYEYKRTDSHYSSIRGPVKKLSNCVFYADAVTDDAHGKKVLVGRLKTDIPGEPLFDITLPISKLPAKGDVVNREIWSQLVEHGSQFKPALLDLWGGPTWFSLLSGFDEYDYVKNLIELGAQDKAVVNFTNARVDTQTGVITPGGVTHNLARDATDMYAEVAKSYGYNRSAVKDIYESKNTLVRKVVTIMVHILHQVATSAVAAHRYVPKHLVVPFTVDDDVWNNAFCQTYTILSGRLRPPLIPSMTGQFNKFVAVNDQLGTLPGMYLHRTSNKLTDWLYSARNSAVLLTHYLQTMPLSRASFTYFAFDDDSEVASRDVLSQGMIDTLREAVPHLVIEFASRVQLSKDCGSTCIPIDRGMQWLKEEVESDVVHTDIKTSFNHTIKGKNNLELFLSMVADAVHNGRAAIAATNILYKADPKKYIGLYSKGKLNLKYNKCFAVLGHEASNFSIEHLKEQDNANHNESTHALVVDESVWRLHYLPSGGNVLTMGDLQLVKSS